MPYTPQTPNLPDQPNPPPTKADEPPYRPPTGWLARTARFGRELETALGAWAYVLAAVLVLACLAVMLFMVVTNPVWFATVGGLGTVATALGLLTYLGGRAHDDS